MRNHEPTKPTYTKSDVVLTFTAIAFLIVGAVFGRPFGEQLFCALLGLIFLKMAYAWLDRDKAGQAFVFTLIAAGFFICTLSGMQSLIKTNVLWKFTKALDEYGNKIDTFQGTVTGMRDDLKLQQLQLSSNQTTLATVQTNIQKAQIGISESQQGITNQFKEITYLQEQISAAQTNLNKQETELSDVQYWVQNLFSKRMEESVLVADTNRVTVVEKGDGGYSAFVKLASVPITNSIDVFINGGMGQQRLVGGTPSVQGNILCVGLYGYNANNTTLSFSYIADARKTNLYPRPPILNKDMTVFYTNSTVFWLLRKLPWDALSVNN